MTLGDTLGFALSALSAQRTRAGLTALGVAVGILAVTLLTSLGEGVQRFVLAEFSQFGTHLLAVTAGKTQTFGMSGAMISSVRPLTLDDAAALQRVDGVEGIVPVLQGNARIEIGGRSRRAMVLGVSAQVPEVWKLELARGNFLADESLQNPRAFAVLGATLERELFGAANPPVNPLGARIGVGHQRYRVVGTVAPKGQFLGLDLDDVVFIPAARALALFDRASLMEIDVKFSEDIEATRIAERVRRLLMARHGREDFTVTTQAQMLEVLDSILNVLKLAVGALGGIALFVGAVGIATIMSIAIRERTAEIGLLRALGASRGDVNRIFLTESLLLAGFGGVAGIAAATGLIGLLALLMPGIPFRLLPHYALLAELIALATGLLAGVLPASRAGALVPLEALRAE